MTTGRPTKYRPDMVFQAEDYLEKYESLGELVPSIAGLALYLGVSRSTIKDWAGQKSKKDFSATLEKIKAKQELKLLNGGLGGSMNPTITKLALANHGYSDKVETDLTSSDGSMTPRGLNDYYADIGTEADS